MSGSFIPPSVLSGALSSPKINPAKWNYEKLAEIIKDFEAELDNEHEVGARLVSFGQSALLHIEDVGYYGPDIITFYGRNEVGEKYTVPRNSDQYLR